MLLEKRRLHKNCKKFTTSMQNYCSAVEGVNKLARSIKFEKKWRASQKGRSTHLSQNFQRQISSRRPFWISSEIISWPSADFRPFLAVGRVKKRWELKSFLTIETHAFLQLFKLFWCFCISIVIACLNYYENNLREIVNSSVRHVLTVSQI
jgi:hypothetical protein